MTESLKKTIFFERHKSLGARFVPFSGYEMPVQYTAGVIEEHLRVRRACGLFDVAHMGALEITGPDTETFLNYVLTRDFSKCSQFQGAYSLLCYENGGTVDDLIAYKFNSEKYILILNAGNKDKDYAYLKENSKEYKISFRSLFESHSLLALQGPKSFALLERLNLKPKNEKAFTFEECLYKNEKVLVFQTGYTGEQGVEILISNQNAISLFDEILEKGSPFEILPCGLASRDTLRSEMGYSLYGHELSDTINPVEVGLSWAIGWNKENFLGRNALIKTKENPQRKLLCLKNASRQAPRSEMLVYDSNQQQVGYVCTGTFAPSLGHGIAMALVNVSSAGPYSIEIRNQKIPFEETKRPFFKKIAAQ